MGKMLHFNTVAESPFVLVEFKKRVVEDETALHIHEHNIHSLNYH